ncbi:MAG: cytochrome c, partial [Planctomycetaceae bacterium]|nr:cytochrome c [Planctomycetaceae bacterium]
MPNYQSTCRRAYLAATLLGSLVCSAVQAESPVQADTSAANRGYRALTEKAFLPTDFSQEVFDATWRTWPEPLKSKAARSSLAERRQLAFQRYGLTPRPHDSSGKPLQYVVDAKGNWSLNCFSCHGGKVSGQVIPGLPNTHYAM